MRSDVDAQSRSVLTDLMRDGQWIFHRLGAPFIAEMVNRAAQILGECGGDTVQVSQERLAALPSYRLSALALQGVEIDQAPSGISPAPQPGLSTLRLADWAGADGSSILLDCGPRESELPPFWRAVLHSFNTSDYYPDTSPVHYCPPTAAHHRAFAAALALLKARLPEAHAAMTGWIKRVVVVRGPELGGSSPRFFGCILMPASYFERTAAAFAGELVHEMAHQELFVMNAYDRLVEPAGDDLWRFSIFAGVRRPTMGRLHAAHAIFRMIQAARATDQGSLLLRGKLWRTVRTFLPGDLTPLAQAIVRDVYWTALRRGDASPTSSGSTDNWPA